MTSSRSSATYGAPLHKIRAPKDAVRGPRIVALGGGTGLPAVLEGLSTIAADFGEDDTDALTGVVTVTDEGGSSGRLRRRFGVLPPGDVRN